MFFICCRISSGLKDEVGPGCVAGLATGAGGVLMAVVWIGMERMEVGQLVEVGGMEGVVGDD